MPLVLDGSGGISGVDGTASNPAIEGTDSNTGIFYPAADTVAIGTGGTERLRVDSSGNLGVGTSSPATLIDSRINQNNTYSATGLSATASTALTLKNNTTAGAVNNFVALRFDPNDVFARAEICAVYDATNASALTFKTEPNGGDPTERMRLDSSGRLLVGSTSARANFFNGSVTTASQIEGTEFGKASQAILINSTTDYPFFVLARSRGTTIGSNTVVANGDIVGEIVGMGNDGSEFVQCAAIDFVIDGTPGANDMPGRIVFSTTADGTAGTIERARITTSGLLSLTQSTANGAYLRCESFITLASNATINITSNICGAALICVYDRPNGFGGVFFANYSANVVKLAGDGAATDTGTSFSVYKNSFAHTTTIRNRQASSVTYAIAVYSADGLP